MKRFTVCCFVFLAAAAFTACGIEEKDDLAGNSPDVVADNGPTEDATPDLGTDTAAPDTAPEAEPDQGADTVDDSTEVTPDIGTDEGADTAETEPDVTPDTTPDTPVCVPDCAGKACGDDGCGGECGTCGDLPCKGTPECLEGACVYPVVVCDDHDPCTADSCDMEFDACKYKTVKCDDGNPCTEDSCVKGEGCIYTPKSCDDENSCTADACDVETGACTNEAKVCNDGLNYTVDTCDPATGACVFTVAVGACTKDTDCADGNPCTEDVCDSITNRCKAVEVVCDDGNPCTTEKCQPAPIGVLGYICVPEWKTCDDANACTWDWCDEETGECTHGDASCDDGNACTTDTCNPETGCSSDPVSCDDGNRCTADFCGDWMGGCYYKTVSGCCNSDNDCGVGSWCNQEDQGGTCWALNCYSDQCGGFFVDNHKCSPWTAEKGTSCDDGNPDTPKTECDGAGGCVSVPLCTTDADCNDGNAATKDFCDKSEKAWKCVNEPIAQQNVCLAWMRQGTEFSTIYGCVGEYSSGTSFDCNGGWGEWRDRANYSGTGWNIWCAEVSSGDAMLAVVNFGPAVNVNGASIYWAPAGDGQGNLLVTGEMWYSQNGGNYYTQVKDGNVPICATGGAEPACLLPNGQQGANLLIRP